MNNKIEKPKKINKPLKIVEDFVERWNKQDKEKEVAQAIQDLRNLLQDLRNLLQDLRNLLQE